MIPESLYGSKLPRASTFTASKSLINSTYFFSNFKILNLNIFEESVFDDTSYTVISFSFIKCKNCYDTIEIKSLIKPSNTEYTFTIDKKFGFRIGSRYHDLIKSNSNIGIKRLLVGGEPNSKLFLRAIDTGSDNGRISLSIKDFLLWYKNR